MATDGNPEPRHLCGLLVAMQAMNINTESGCSEATDPNPSAATGAQMPPWPQVAMQATQMGGGTCGDMAIRHQCDNLDPV